MQQHLGACRRPGGRAADLAFVEAGTTSQEPYNHFSLLRTIEDLFGVAHLGYTADSKAGSLPASLFSAYRPR